MDKIDLEIARILSKNARTPFRKIAVLLGVSPQMVARRYKKLRKKAFSYSSITINLEKLGFKASAAFCLKISKEKRGEISKIYEKIIRFPNVIVASKILGEIDVYFLAPLKSFEDAFDFQRRLSEIEGIEEVEVTLYKIYKNWPKQLYNRFLK